MKVCFLISGLLRQFQHTLLPFLSKLEKDLDFDVYIHSSNQSDDTKFSSNMNVNLLDTSLTGKSLKLFIYEKIPEDICPPNCDQREKNTFIQWYRIKRLYESIPDIFEYDLFIRIRPDIQIECTPAYFLNILNSISTDHITIPTGNDIFNSKYLQPTESIQPVNDQVAFIPRHFLSLYAGLYTVLTKSNYRPLISEYSLAKHLHTHTIDVKRIDLPYTIVLSTCKVLALTGDSASGKSTILTALQEVFPFDSQVTLETDRYHRWERGNKEWKRITHLHPDANNLEKLLDDTYRLKIGENIYMVDYDHTSGTFTELQQVKSRENILLCGLHTLYQEELRDHLDVKIYVDTELSLKTFWKIQRDHVERGYTIETVLQRIQEREKDFQSYIAPQKDFANILITYKPTGMLPTDYTQYLTETDFSMDITLHKTLMPICYFILTSCASHFETVDADYTRFFIRPQLSLRTLFDCAKRENLQHVPTTLREGYLGVLQLLILRLFFVDLK